MRRIERDSSGASIPPASAFLPLTSIHLRLRVLDLRVKGTLFAIYFRFWDGHISIIYCAE